MKKLIALVTLVLLCACSHLERNSYISIGSIGATANAAIGAYNSYVQVHGATPEQLASARHVVTLYVDAMETARHVTVAFKNGQAKEPAVGAALTALTAASAELSKTLIDLSNP